MTAMTFQLDSSINQLSFIQSSAVIHRFLHTVSCRRVTFWALLVARFIEECHFVAMCACSRAARTPAYTANNRVTPAPSIALVRYVT